ncbi:endonuclease [Myroides sp. mNGS23_01]|nr:endonuclease [Myroides sp. mNGS23_01]WHT38469.1 endonuclease [Myroides sp. mNGS23_01]
MSTNKCSSWRKNDRDAHMVNILLQWNAEDPVSAIEIQRNEYLSKPEIQGNRNPFIDNPHLATQLWGGPVAENRW